MSGSADIGHRVLILLPRQEDAERTCAVLAKAGIDCDTFEDVPGLCRALPDGAGALLVAEELMDSDSGDVLARALRAQPLWAPIPLIILTNPGPMLPRERFLATAMAHVALVERPIRASALVGVVEEALRIRQRQAEVRDAIVARGHLAAIVESSEDAIVSKTLEGIILTWNDGARRLFGYEAAEAIGKPITMIIPPDRLDEERSILERLRRGERIAHFETVRIAKDGRQVDVSLSVSPIRDGSGRIVAASKSARDIGGRKSAEEALREEHRTVELLNTIGNRLAAELDLGRLLQAMTDETTALTGAAFGAFFYNTVDERGGSYTLYTLSGAPREAFEKFPHPRATAIFEPTFSGTEVVRLGDVTRDPRYGQNAPYRGMPEGHLPVRSYLAIPVRSRSGDMLGGLFFGHPESNMFTSRHERLAVGVAAQAAVAIDNARLVEALRDEHRRKDEFIAILSHELRTPLNAILGWTRVLRAGEAGMRHLGEALEVIERNSKAQAQLIDDLMDISRIVAGKLRLDVQRVDLVAVLDSAIDAVMPSADAKGIRVNRVFDSLVGSVSGDASRLQQVFWNLLANAVKFTPKGGRVQVLLERVNSHVEVSIIDTGQGISPDFLPRVFDRFLQMDSTTTRRHGGLGLGLAIVKQLVEMHGGTVRAKSPGEGAGATFTVMLPIVAIHEERSQPGGPWKAEPSEDRLEADLLAGIEVLVIDDDQDARDLIAQILASSGASVSLAPGAREALGRIEAVRPDVLISDVGMPGMDGYEFLREVRRMHPARELPAAALTAFARAEDRKRALLAGFQTHIAKPVDPAELVAVVASLIGRTGHAR